MKTLTFADGQQFRLVKQGSFFEMQFGREAVGVQCSRDELVRSLERFRADRAALVAQATISSVPAVFHWQIGFGSPAAGEIAIRCTLRVPEEYDAVIAAIAEVMS
jgi:hypothetical protein